MKNVEFAAACLYWYVKNAVSLGVDVFFVLALLFMIHKLVSWAIWVMSV